MSTSPPSEEQPRTENSVESEEQSLPEKNLTSIIRLGIAMARLGALAFIAGGTLYAGLYTLKIGLEAVAEVIPA